VPRAPKAPARPSAAQRHTFSSLRVHGGLGLFSVVVDASVALQWPTLVVATVCGRHASPGGGPGGAVQVCQAAGARARRRSQRRSAHSPSARQQGPVRSDKSAGASQAPAHTNAALAGAFADGPSARPGVERALLEVDEPQSESEAYCSKQDLQSVLSSSDQTGTVLGMMATNPNCSLCIIPCGSRGHAQRTSVHPRLLASAREQVHAHAKAAAAFVGHAYHSHNKLR
jgi:hypothetical protein